MKTIHGTLVRIYGKGILLIGESGIGKSDCALELIARGHVFVADDSVEVCKRGDIIWGRSPAVLQDLMEIKGLGIIDIPKIFGRDSICPECPLSIVAAFEKWNDMRRIGRERAETSFNILDVSMPLYRLPVRSSGGMATIIEVLVKNHTIESEGYIASKELSRRVDEEVLGKNNLSCGHYVIVAGRKP